MTPLPKQRSTSGRRDRRRSHDALKARNAVNCPNCGEIRLPPSCLQKLWPLPGPRSFRSRKISFLSFLKKSDQRNSTGLFFNPYS